LERVANNTQKGYNSAMKFSLAANFTPTGDQPQAIEKLTAGVKANIRDQVLLGVTGSGKTFTVANVIQQTQKPTLVIAHNKTLAAQLYQEFRDFFPNNAVSYFVSYYDYYQPEAYIPTTDTYIEKEATINDEIDKLRLATTTNLLTRQDVIVVSSVSCIYNLGSPVEYGRYLLEIMEGEIISRETLVLQLANLQYERSDAEFKRGTYRIRGDIIHLWPAYEDTALKIDTLENKIISINRIDPVTGSVINESDHKSLSRVNADQNTQSAKKYIIYPAKHYVVNPKTQEQAITEIKADLDQRLTQLKAANKIIEAYRLEQKVNYDLEMIREFGFVNGIENYSRYFDGRQPGQPPFTLLDYFKANASQFGDGSFLTVIDESHITVPQIRGMYNGDQSRKGVLVDYGFRLPSATDNRPLQFHEFRNSTNITLFVSATPNAWEISEAKNEVVEQLVRPTGLLDPPIELRPIDGQVEDLIIEVINRKMAGQRVLVTTLTKKMAETLTEYLNDETKVRKLVSNYFSKQKQLEENPNPERVVRNLDVIPVDEMPIGPIDSSYYTTAHAQAGISPEVFIMPKVAYLHSDVETLERSDILDDLRRGVYDVVVGINLLREGLDLPEVTLVAILDADKEGFLRSATSLVQTMGRAARHAQGQVVLYADKLTASMQKAIGETQRRRVVQQAYNETHGLSPQTISKPIRDRMIEKTEEEKSGTKSKPKNKQKSIVLHFSKKDSLELDTLDPQSLTPAQIQQLLPKLKRQMRVAADSMDFELAAIIRDTIKTLESIE
jgi:excinuclease ABC subunit B